MDPCIKEEVESESSSEGEETDSDSDRVEVPNEFMRMLADAFRKGRKDKYRPSVDRLVGDIPGYREGNDMAKFLRSLEVQLKDLGVERRYWKSVLLSKLPVKIKEQVLEIIESERCTFDRLKDALLARVGLTKRELEVKLFSELDKDTRSLVRVGRLKHISKLVESVCMLCNGMEELKLFLTKGLYCKDLGVDEIGVVNSAKVRNLPELMEAATTLKEGLIRSTKASKCYRCGHYGHRSFECRSESKPPRQYLLASSVMRRVISHGSARTRLSPRRKSLPGKPA